MFLFCLLADPYFRPCSSTAAAAGGVSGAQMVTPKVSEPDFVIRGGPSIKQYRILNDKRHILTKDTDNRVSLYDVLKAQRVEDLGPNIDFDEEVKRRSQVHKRKASI